MKKIHLFKIPLLETKNIVHFLFGTKGKKNCARVFFVSPKLPLRFGGRPVISYHNCCTLLGINNKICFSCKKRRKSSVLVHVDSDIICLFTLYHRQKGAAWQTHFNVEDCHIFPKVNVISTRCVCVCVTP